MRSKTACPRNRERRTWRGADWQRIHITNDRYYVVSFCRDARGHRFCAASEVGTLLPEMVFQTRPVSGKVMRALLAARGTETMWHFRLATGQFVVVAANGEWCFEEDRATLV